MLALWWSGLYCCKEETFTFTPFASHFQRILDTQRTLFGFYIFCRVENFNFLLGIINLPSTKNVPTDVCYNESTVICLRKVDLKCKFFLIRCWLISFVLVDMVYNFWPNFMQTLWSHHDLSCLIFKMSLFQKIMCY